uniref:Uncharacterized protein n=1 Tax=Magallana gigas TaxID=29159 RepID=K1QIA2_MAGGI
MKKKCEKSENSGIEEEQRRLRRISGGSDGDSVMERTVHQSDSSSQSDDPQLNKKPYKTHKRSGSDQRVTFLQQRQSSAPSTPSHHSANSSPGSHFDDYTSRPKTNVKRTASFHGETPSAKKEVQPRRSGSDAKGKAEIGGLLEVYVCPIQHKQGWDGFGQLDESSSCANGLVCMAMTSLREICPKPNLCGTKSFIRECLAD